MTFSAAGIFLLIITASAFSPAPTISREARNFIWPQRARISAEEAGDGRVPPKLQRREAAVVAAILASVLTPANSVVAAEDRTDRTFLVTGANGGIGGAVASGLAASGCRVVVGCRSPEKSSKVAEALLATFPGAKVICPTTPLELSDMRTVATFAQEVGASVPALEGVLLCAGIDGAPLTRGAQGLELHLAVNHASNFLLVMELLDKLRKTNIRGERGKVVVLTSSAALDADPRGLADLNWATRAYDKREAYCLSKACNVLFTDELARREKSAGGGGEGGVRAVSVDPGPTVSSIVRYELPQRAKQREGMTLAQLDRQAKQLGLRSPRQAAELPTSLGYAGLAGDSKPLTNGGFYLGAAVPPGDMGPLWLEPIGWRNPRLAALVWEETERLIGDFKS